MGKKARRLKLSKEQDPIIKRIRKKRPLQQDQEQEEEEISQNNHQDDELNHIINAKDQANSKGYYQQFLQKMNIKKNIEIEQDINQRNLSILAKQQIKSKIGSKFRKVNFYQLIQNQYENHFLYNYQHIQDQICVKQQKQNILEDFYGKESLMNTLNNNVEFKEFQIEPKMKNKQLIDVGLEEEDIQIEELTKLQSIQENQFKIKSVDNFRSSIIDDYFDYIHTDPEEQNSAQFRDCYINHILNHLKLKRIAFGFTRCKVLILSPFKGDAIDIIDRLIQNNQVINKDRYDSEFCDEERLQEDDFRMGIAFSKKKDGLFKLYANFEKADIIIASPLGLRLVTGQKGDLKETHFLSSIEILIIDRASAILMQNWQHLESILELVNSLPEHKHITQALDTISPYYFENMAKFYRQSIIYTNHYFSELNYIRQIHFSNYKGCLSNRLYYLPIFKNSDNFQQEFRLFDAQNPENGLEQRHIKFKKLWNDIENKEPEKFKKTVIFIQSYYDFIKLKNHFKNINSQVECISEYTKKPKVQSLIAKFNQNKINYVMITERAYYFEVCQLMKMKNLIFFQLPQHSFIYKSLIQDLYQIEKAKIISFVSKYDAYQLEYIVGTSITEDILQNKEIIYIL